MSEVLGSVLILVSTLMMLGWLFPETPCDRWCYDTTTAEIVSALTKVQRKHVIMLVIGLVARLPSGAMMQAIVFGP